LQEPCHIKVQIFNFQGKIIRVLEDTQKDSGFYNVTWETRNESGAIVSPGLYFYNIQTTTGITETRRIIYNH
jgi:flagellar hook assembly protein FlgD